MTEAPTPGDSNLGEPNRRQFLEFMGKMAAAVAVAGVAPLSGCESSDEKIRRIGKENPEIRDETDALLELNRAKRLRESGEEDESNHGTLKCWGQVFHHLGQWAKDHWDTLFFTTGGATTHLIPGDTWIENFFGRALPLVFTLGNGALRGILAPETLYSIFMLFIDKWYSWGAALVARRRTAGGGGGAGGGPVP